MFSLLLSLSQKHLPSVLHRLYKHKLLAGKIFKQQVHNIRAHQYCVLPQFIPRLLSPHSTSRSLLNCLTRNILFWRQIKTLLTREWEQCHSSPVFVIFYSHISPVTRQFSTPKVFVWCLMNISGKRLDVVVVDARTLMNLKNKHLSTALVDRN